MKNSPQVREQGWRCPQCGRRFRQRTREHSCDVRSVEAHLVRASPAVRSTFVALQDALATIGPHAMVAVKTMILLRASANFAGIVVRRDTINVEFASTHAVRSARIHKTDRLGPRRYTHHTRLASPADVDGELTAWLSEAYEATLVSRKP